MNPMGPEPRTTGARRFGQLPGIIAVLLMLAASPAMALPILAGTDQGGGFWTGSGAGAGDNALAASAEFSIVNGDLVITLTNTSGEFTEIPPEVLTAIFFDIEGNTGELTPLSAVLAAGSTVIGNVPSPATDPGPDGVGGEWDYEFGLSGSGPPGDANHGISSTGLDLFSEGDFGGDNLQGPDAVNGGQYGIVSAGGVGPDATGPLDFSNSNYAYIQNSVVFTLSGLGDDFDIDSISNVQFLYGTSLDDIPVPEPATLLLLGIGLVGFLRKRFVA